MKLSGIVTFALVGAVLASPVQVNSGAPRAIEKFDGMKRGYLSKAVDNDHETLSKEAKADYRRNIDPDEVKPNYRRQADEEFKADYWREVEKEVKADYRRDEDKEVKADYRREAVAKDVHADYRRKASPKEVKADY